MKLLLTILSVFQLFVAFSQAQEYTAVTDQWVPDGSINGIVHDSVNNRLIVAGDFTGFRHKTYGMDQLDPLTGQPNDVLPHTDDEILFIAADGSGGYFVTGLFGMIGDSIRNGIAHLDAGMNVTAWTSNTTIPPREIVVRDNYIFVNNTTYCFAINKTTGDQLPWTINVVGLSSIKEMEFLDGYLYIGGDFPTLFIPDTIQKRALAQVDPVTGTVTSWTASLTPNTASTIVHALHVDGDKLYVGGSFTQAMGSTRNRVFRVTSTGGVLSLDTWNPNANSVVYDIETRGSKVMILGLFSTIGGSARAGVAYMNKNNTTLHSFNPGAGLGGSTSSQVKFLDDRIYIRFNTVNTTVGGQSRSRLVSFDTMSYAVTSWNPSPNEDVNLFIENGTIFTEGWYNLIGYTTRPLIAALDPITLDLLSWTPAIVGNSVKSVMIAEDKLFVSGSFGTPGNYIYRIGVLNLLTGAEITPPQTIIGQGNLLGYNDGYFYVSRFIGDYYQSPTGPPDMSFARIDVNTLTFDVNFDLQTLYQGIEGAVTDIEFVDSLAYFSGLFNEVLGQPRSSLACFNINTLQLDNFNPVFPINVLLEQVEVSGNEVYFLGPFNQVNGEARYQLGSMNRFNAVLDDWAPDLFNTVALINTFNRLIVKGNYVYVGGFFQNLIPEYGVAIFRKNSGEIMPFTLSDISNVHDMCFVDSRLHIVGDLFALEAPAFGEYYLAYDFCEEVNSVDTVYETSFNWFGNILNQSGYYYHTIPDPLGCDSTYTLELTLMPYLFDSTDVTSCYSFDWSVNGATYNTSGVYIDTLVTAIGADTVYVLNLTINQASYSSLTETACDSYFWSETGVTYTGSGQYYDTIPNVSGCDSIITLNLTINQTSGSSLIETACDSYFWDENGLTYNASGIYYDTLANLSGCDSIITLNLTIYQSSFLNDTIVATGSYTWLVNGINYLTSGIYSDTILNVAGCDSIQTLHLTVNETFGVATFSMPSDANECLGGVVITAESVPDFTFDIGNGDPVTSSSGYTYIDSLCPGIYSVLTTNGNGDTVSTIFVIPVDSNYVFNNPFIDSIAVDSLGTTIEDCDIYYNSIDSGYIADIFVNADTVTVTWDIIDANGVTSTVTTYILGNGNGVYYLQLDVYCPEKVLGSFFTVIQSVYFDDQGAHLLDVFEDELFNLTVFPNPTNESVTITFMEPYLSLTIFDLNGKVLHKEELNSGEEVSLYEMESGVYLFQFEAKNGRSVRRIIKN